MSHGKGTKKTRRRVRSQESGVRDCESDRENRGNAGADEVFSAIFSKLSAREREFLWGYLEQTDAHELAYSLGVEVQTVHNHLALIEEKLGLGSRAELLTRVFAALLAQLQKS